MESAGKKSGETEGLGFVWWGSLAQFPFFHCRISPFFSCLLICVAVLNIARSETGYGLSCIQLDLNL